MSKVIGRGVGNQYCIVKMMPIEVARRILGYGYNRWFTPHHQDGADTHGGLGY